MLYVFLILSGLFCNQFAFEHAGMRTFILSPLDRKNILIGKNMAISAVALIFSAGLLVINQLVFRDLTRGALLFVGSELSHLRGDDVGDGKLVFDSFPQSA